MSDQAQGNGSPNQPQGQSAPGAFTDTQLEQISQIAAQVVNSGFTARTKKLREEIMGDLNKGLEPLSKRLEELMASPPGKTGKGKGKDDDEGASDPKFAGLQRQLAEMKQQLDDRDRKLAESEQKQRAVALRQSLVKSLADNGMSDQRRADLAATTLLATGQVKLDDDGSPVFVENENSLLDLSTGIKAWSKTEDAKIFLPPTGARGSGDRPGQGAPRTQQNAGEATATDLGLALVREFGGISVGT